MFRTAFTMLELIFVIIVIGIISVLAMPSFNRNPLAEAAEQVANHIRYTQHLAMVDDRFNPTNPLWHTEMWVFRIHELNDVNNNNESEWFYEVFSDRSNDTESTIDEEAADPLTGQTLGNGSFNNTVPDDKIINLTRNFGIKNVAFSGGTNAIPSGATRVAFDNLGRPYRNAVSNPGQNWRDYILQSDMNITLTDDGNNKATITIRRETGYVSVSY